MAQSDIIKLLNTKAKPLSRTEIAELLGETPTKISAILRRLLKYKEIKYIELDRVEAMDKYGCKHRMRLWFIDGSC